MLVLSRKSHEKLVLPTLDTTIEVLEIKGNVVRIGIQAPSGVTILRAELTETPSRRAIESHSA